MLPSLTTRPLHILLPLVSGLTTSNREYSCEDVANLRAYGLRFGHNRVDKSSPERHHVLLLALSEHPGRL